MSGPLAGIRILEVGHMLAGPYCGMLLADISIGKAANGFQIGGKLIVQMNTSSLYEVFRPNKVRYDLVHPFILEYSFSTPTPVVNVIKLFLE